MQSKREMKKKAHLVIKKHYFILLLVCLIASFIGSEFVTTTLITRNTNNIISVEKRIFSDIRTNIKIDENKIAQKTEKDAKKIIKDLKDVSQVVNTIDNGSIFIKATESILAIIISMNEKSTILIFFSFILVFLGWYYIQNTYIVISRRIFLESRIYDKVSFQRFLFLLRIRKWSQASFTMFLTTIYQLLWNLTIIGGIIKRY